MTGVQTCALPIWDNLGIIGVKGSNEKAPAKIYIPGWLGWIFTFGFFNLSLFFFRSDNMADAFQMFRNVFAFKNTGYLYKVVVNLDIPEFYLLKQVVNMVRPDLLNYMYMMIFFLVLIISGFILTRKNTAQIVNDCPLNTKLCLFVILVFVWSVISFSQVSTFIYFNF